ncbi:hypothetical protein [Caballeronia sordidicola]|uniref:hypothetical protein n=1 Tax=Caballeronia sordidicola TaxID=196367 RepID=UPI000A393B38|nr:hypothetical protein [Caballeronia sordidicola]
MSVWNGKRFVDLMPLTAAAEAATTARARGRSADAKQTHDGKPCGCDATPVKSKRTTDALLPLDNRGYWNITKR